MSPHGDGISEEAKIFMSIKEDIGSMKASIDDVKKNTNQIPKIITRLTVVENDLDTHASNMAIHLTNEDVEHEIQETLLQRGSKWAGDHPVVSSSALISSVILVIEYFFR